MDEWQEAFNGLSPKLKSCLIRAREEKADVLTALLREAELKKTLCLVKRWKVNLGGKTIVLRDLFDKIIAWVYKFKAIGDTAVQFDPAPATLAWAANEELEKIAELDTEVDRLTRISDAEVQLQIQDDMHKTQTIPKSIQTPFSRVVDASTIYAKSVEEQQFRQLLTWMSSVPYLQHHARHSEARLQGSTEWLFKHPRYTEWNETSTSSILLLHGIPGSGKTSLTSSVVDSFLRSKSQNPLAAPVAYFYCGDSKMGRYWADPEETMGCLTRQVAVIDRQKLEVHEHVLLEYQRKAAEANLDGFDVPKLKISQCADLILGVLGSNPAILVVDGVDEIEETRRYELLDALKRIRDESASVVKIFLSGREDRNILGRLSDALMLRVEENDTRLDIELFVKNKVLLGISTLCLLGGEVPRDLQEELIAFLLNRSRGMFLWVTLQLNCFFRLKTRASVVASIQDSSKATCESLSDLYSEMLGHLHEADPSAYDIANRAFSWLLCMHEPLTPQALLFTVSMSSPEEQRNFTLPELLDFCFNLIYVDSKLNTLRFVHFSFIEYLKTKPEFSVPCINTIAATGCLNACIQDTPSNLEDTFNPKDNFVLYAALYWTQHYQNAAIGNDHSPILSKLEKFAFNNDGETNLSFMAWLDTVHIAAGLLSPDHPLKAELNSVTSMQMTPLFAGCIYGIEEIVQSVVTREGFDVNKKSTTGHTPLYLAAKFGHDEIIRILLSYGADVGLEGGKHGNSVNAACANGHVSATNLLLSHQSTSISSDDVGLAVQKALISGHENVALFLLQNSVELPDHETYTKTAEQASRAGMFKLVQWLDKEHPSLSNANEAQSRILDMAILKGQLSFIKRYCSKLQFLDNSVANAACMGHVDIVSFCLDQGASIEEEGPLGSPLRAASLMGHEMAVRLLIARGASINAPGKFGDALQAAAMNGHWSITQFLIQNKADVNAQGGYYGNPLQAAASRGHLEVAEALINAGARIAAKGRYKDAFLTAAEAGHHAVVGLFIEKGFQLPQGHVRSIMKGLYQNLLWTAWNDAHGSLVHKEKENNLLSLPLPDPGLGVSFNTLKDGISSTPRNRNTATPVRGLKAPTPVEYSSLVLAASKGWDLVVQCMVTEREKIKLGQAELELALEKAAYHGHVGVLKIILASDIEKNWKILNALMAAAQTAQITIIQILIHHVADSDVLSWDNALLVLRYGSRENQISSVRYCLSHVMDKERHALVALAFKHAAKFNSVGVLKSLDQDGNYIDGQVVRQAFQIAASNGSTDVVQLIIGSDFANSIQSEDYLVAFRGASFYGHAVQSQSLLGHVSSPCSPEHLKVLFINAAYKGYRGVLSVLLPEIKNLDCCQTLLDTCLCFACAEGEFDAASFLIEAGACVNARADSEMKVDENPALAGLCLDKDTDEQRPLIEPTDSRFSVYYKNCGKWTALQACLKSPRQFQFRRGDSEGPRALDKKHFAVLQLLILHDVDVNVVGEDGLTPLHWALSRETMCFPMVSLLLNAGPESYIEEAEAEGRYPLLQTALRFFEGGGCFKDCESVEEVFTTGPGAVIRLLLESKPNISATDRQFRLVLEMAATVGNADFIQLLVERGVDVNTPVDFFSHALIAAAAFGHNDCVQLLVTTGADVNISHPLHGTALQIAVIGGHTRTARILLDHGADIDVYTQASFPSITSANSAALQLAIDRGYFEIANLLLDAGANFNISPPFVSPPLVAACGQSNLEFVKDLLQRGANVNIDGQRRESSNNEVLVASEEASALHKACARGRNDLVSILLEGNADIEKRVGGSLTPIEVAARAGHLVVLDQLLDAGATIYDPSRGVNALREACRGKDPIPSTRLLRGRLKAESGSEDFISAFEEAVPEVLRKGCGDTLVCLIQDLPKIPSLLHHACVLGSTDAVELMLYHGIDVNFNFESGGQPLHIACYYQRVELVPLLIKSGATVHEEDLKYGTPIQAALEGYIASGLIADDKPFHDMVPTRSPLQTLSNNYYGASRVSRQDLIVASESNVLALVSAGATADAKERPIGPPLHLAAFIGSIPILQLLLQTGVDINTVGGYFDSALIAAVYAKQQNTIVYLLGQGIDANLFSAEFGTALNLACHQENQNKTKTVRALLKHRADVNANGSESESPVSALLSSNMTSHKPSIAEDTLEIILQSAANLKVRPEDLVLAVTVDDKCGSELREELTERLLKHDPTAQVTIEVIKHAAKCYGSGDPENRLAMLLSHSNGIYVTEDILEAASSPEILEVLLQHNPRCGVTEALFKTFARSDSWLGKDYLEVLLDGDISATPTIAVIQGLLEARFRPEEGDAKFNNILEMLFDRNPNIEVTEEMLAATMNSKERDILLSRAHKVSCE
ncbi:hypothetical protein PEX1_030150 [Penicillium expansum]|nr:hypothetical protein PEX1_030150 [Penicillium expansum]